MKKTLMSVVMASVLVSGSAFAVGDNLNSTGKGDNGDSQAELHFTGKVTTSHCQVATDDVKKEIELGEITASQLQKTDGKGRGPSKGFTVDLVNCDSALTKIDYIIRDANGTDSTKQYLLPKQNDESALGVGVYLVNADDSALTNKEGSVTAAVDSKNNALSHQSIALAAYLGTVTGNPASATPADANYVTPGLVDATGVMTIKTTVK